MQPSLFKFDDFLLCPSHVCKWQFLVCENLIGLTQRIVNLDCETLELAEQSLAAILGIDRARLCEQVREFKITDFEVHTSLMDDRWRPMLNAVAGHEIADTDCGKTCWFHATRAKDFSSFRQGILPLPRKREPDLGYALSIGG